jgi:hypothetical protein
VSRARPPHRHKTVGALAVGQARTRGCEEPRQPAGQPAGQPASRLHGRARFAQLCLTPRRLPRQVALRDELHRAPAGQPRLHLELRLPQRRGYPLNTTRSTP